MHKNRKYNSESKFRIINSSINRNNLLDQETQKIVIKLTWDKNFEYNLGILNSTQYKVNINFSTPDVSHIQQLILNKSN